MPGPGRAFRRSITSNKASSARRLSAFPTAPALFGGAVGAVGAVALGRLSVSKIRTYPCASAPFQAWRSTCRMRLTDTLRGRIDRLQQPHAAKVAAQGSCSWGSRACGGFSFLHFLIFLYRHKKNAHSET